MHGIVKGKKVKTYKTRRVLLELSIGIHHRTFVLILKSLNMGLVF